MLLFLILSLAFISSFPDFVFFMPKLLVPSVSNYQENPAEYINNRALALYTFIHWRINWYSFNNETVDWNEETLTKDWGKANNISTQDYVERLAAALGTSQEGVKSVPTPNIIFQLKQFMWDSISLPLMRRGPYRVFY